MPPAMRAWDDFKVSWLPRDSGSAFGWAYCDDFAQSIYLSGLGGGIVTNLQDAITFPKVIGKIPKVEVATGVSLKFALKRTSVDCPVFG
jgi:hypothetical protein